MDTKIGFIGQGWIGKHYADDFENRGYHTVRYALEEPFQHNKEQLKECDVVFIAVPTPSTPDGFSCDAVISALNILIPGTTAVIKSTLLPGTTETLQTRFPNLHVLHSPEFLREVTAAHDAANPDRNLIGFAIDTPAHRARAEAVLKILPKARYDKIMPAREAELVKYAGNCFLYSKVVFMNAVYDLIDSQGADFELVREAMANDPRIGESHTRPVHKSGHVQADERAVRGAGGHCFIKDFEAFRSFYCDTVGTDEGYHMLSAMIEYNKKLLLESKKDLDILAGVYGEDSLQRSCEPR